MANPTTYFGWVMPNSADLVTDLPADFNVFGQGVDTSMQYLLGGTTGQVLSKTSGTNMAFTWVTPTDQTPLTTKGDLFTFTTVDARLGVGANGTTLVADSTAATGIKWAASPNFVGCGLYKFANQSLTNATITGITFDTEFFDTDAFHSTSTNTSRITIPAGLAGKYQLNGVVRYSGAATGIRVIYFYLNGSVYSYANEAVTITSFDQSISASVVVNLAVGDYVELVGYQNSGGALNVVGASTSSASSFSATYLGA